MQGSAERDVHDLHPAADAQRGQVHPVGGEDEGDLDLVAIGFDPVVVGRVGLGLRSAQGRRRLRPPAAGRRRARAAPPALPLLRARRWRCGRRLAAARRGRGRGPRSHRRASGAPGPRRGGTRPRPPTAGTNHDRAGSSATDAATSTNRSNTARPRCSWSRWCRSASASTCSSDLPHVVVQVALGAELVQPVLQLGRSISRWNWVPRCGRPPGTPGS